jgi:hypothetical protein
MTAAKAAIAPAETRLTMFVVTQALHALQQTVAIGACSA